jgi:hypothetical protein
MKRREFMTLLGGAAVAGAEARAVDVRIAPGRRVRRGV